MLGRHLYQFVFGPCQEAVDRFDRLLEWARGERHLLSVRFSFGGGAGRYSAWPWEFLHHPGGGADGYFLRSHGVVLVREVSAQRNLTSANPPLKVLLALARPPGLPDTDAGGMTEVLNAYARRPKRIELSIADSERFAALRSKVEAFRPDVFHFHGHGDGRGGVMFPDSPGNELINFTFSDTPIGQGVATDGQAIAAMFKGHQPELVLFTACNTALAQVPFTDVAQRLAGIGTGIPAVIAMQFQVGLPVVATFARALYDALTAGEPVASAFSQATSALNDVNVEKFGKLDSSRGFGTPVLFLKQAEGRLVKRSAPAKTAGSGPGMTRPRVPSQCPFCGERAVKTMCCTECGRPRSCPYCHLPYTASGKKCGNCGRPVPQPPSDQATDLAVAHQAGEPAGADQAVIGVDQLATVHSLRR